MKKNPFTLLFGIKPYSYIAREDDEFKVINQFNNDDHGDLFIVTGVRGSGKTVFLTDICGEFKQNDDWIVIDLNSDLNLYESACSKLYKHKDINSLDLKKTIELNLPIVNMSLQEKEPSFASLESALEDMIKIAKKKGKKILFSIDEITNTDEMRKFINSFQIYLRNNLPVFLLASGLPDNVHDLQEEKSLTFLYRAPKINLEPLDLRKIKNQYKALLNIDDDLAIKMAKLTNGYSYAYQLLGSLMYENDCLLDNNLIDKYDEYLADYVYDKVFADLTNKDEFYLEQIALNDYRKVADLVDNLKITNKVFSPYRDRLIKKGLIISNKQGTIELTLPRLKEYIKNKQIFY